MEWIHTQIASQTSELRCKNSFKKSHFLITISPQKNFLSNVILSCSRTDLVKYMHWLRMNSYHIGMNSFLIRMDSFRSRKQVCKNVQYGTVCYSTVQYGTVQFSTQQYSTVQHCIVWYSQPHATVNQNVLGIVRSIHEDVKFKRVLIVQNCSVSERDNMRSQII